MTRRRRGFLLALALAALSACVEENPHPPDALLRDSLGLGDQDRVLRIRVVHAAGAETVDPSEVEVEPGWYAEFVTDDRMVHAVAFTLDSLDGPQSEFLRTTAQDRSPPLVEPRTRFVVSFEGAPPGRYPFVVEGSGTSARGAVTVRDGDRR